MFVTVERELQRQLLLLSCMLHANELDLREVFTKLDGCGTTGPESFGGPVGSQCKDALHLLPVVDFNQIESAIEEIDKTVYNDLSTDQKLLYTYCQAVSSGILPESEARKAPGPLNHAR